MKAPEDIFDEVLTNILKRPYFPTHNFSNHMVQQNKEIPEFPGCIINVSSVSASVASVSRVEYCISKAGIAANTLWLRSG